MSSADLKRLAEASEAGRPAEVTGREVVGETEWLKLETVTYRLAGKKCQEERTWNMASRTTKREGSDYADSVIVLALCKPDQNPHNQEVLLIRQFRPPHNMLSLEIPQGLIDPGEGVADAAIRELKEETGYHGVVKSISPILSVNPGVTDETAQLCVCEVDLTADANKNPVQECEEDEEIDVIRVRLTEFIKTLREFKNDRIIDAVYLFALGFQLGSQSGVLQRAPTPEHIDDGDPLPLTHSGYHARSSVEPTPNVSPSGNNARGVAHKPMSSGVASEISQDSTRQVLKGFRDRKGTGEMPPLSPESEKESAKQSNRGFK